MENEEKAIVDNFLVSRVCVCVGGQFFFYLYLTLIEYGISVILKNGKLCSTLDFNRSMRLFHYDNEDKLKNFQIMTQLMYIR